MDTGLLILRVLVAGILLAHATQKSFGWFSGPGINGATAIFEKLGQHPARTMVIVAALSESAAAILLLAGAVTPLGAAIATGTMIVAGASMHRLSGNFWNSAGGGEYPYFIAVAAAALAFAGPGKFSLDNAVDASWYGVANADANLIGLAAVVVAVLSAIPPLLSGRRAKSSAPAPAPTH